MFLPTVKRRDNVVVCMLVIVQPSGVDFGPLRSERLLDGSGRRGGSYVELLGINQFGRVTDEPTIRRNNSSFALRATVLNDRDKRILDVVLMVFISTQQQQRANEGSKTHMLI